MSVYETVTNPDGSQKVVDAPRAVLANQKETLMKTQAPPSTALLVSEEEFRKLEMFLNDFEKKLSGRLKGFRIAGRESLRGDIGSGQPFWIKLRGISWEHPSVDVDAAGMRYTLVHAIPHEGQPWILISSSRGAMEIGDEYYTIPEARAVLGMVQR